MPSRVRVAKRANNPGTVERGGDASVVTETSDRLWLLSMVEVYGSISSQAGNVPYWSSATYNAEGTQYQLYDDQGFTTISYGFCKKGGACSWWWFRSTDAYFLNGIRDVGSMGSWNGGSGGDEGGVSLGFCL